MPNIQFQVRRGTANTWTSTNPRLANGEFGFETDTRQLKIGNDASWNALPYINIGQAANWSTFPAFQNVDMSGNVVSNILRIQNGAGTVSAPSYTFTNDVSMGLYDPATNVLGFVTSGVEQMRITAAGNVGISTSAPRSLLDVSGTIYGRLPVSVVTATTQALTFGSNDNSYFYITNSSFSNITTPGATTTGQGGCFWQFRNATSSFLSVTLTNSLSLVSPISIAPNNSVTLVVSPVSNNTLLLF